MVTIQKRVPVQVLLIEDNPADARLASEALRAISTPNEVRLAVDGEEALAYLRREKGDSDARQPALILLDLNLPKMDGRQVLAEIKKDARLRKIPVIVLTASSAESDIRACYDLHANGYVIKPFGYEQYVEKLKSVSDFWLSIVMLPPG